MLITKGNPLEFRGERDGDLVVPVLLPRDLSKIHVVSSNLRKHLCENHMTERIIYNDYLIHMQRFSYRDASIAFARSSRLIFFPLQEYLLKDTFLLRESLSRLIKKLHCESEIKGLIFPDIEIELNFIMQEVSKLENRRVLFVLDDDRQDLEDKKEGGVMVSGKIC